MGKEYKEKIRMKIAQYSHARQSKYTKSARAFARLLRRGRKNRSFRVYFINLSIYHFIILSFYHLVISYYHAWKK